MSYESKGRQFVVITAAGHSNVGSRIGDYTIAYALPITP
ncbi:UNVERIFIED_ORG: glucose dehydrogenase [Rhizobium aethiopicum]